MWVGVLASGAAACSGQSFSFIETTEPITAGDAATSAFPPLVPNTSLGDAGLLPDTEPAPTPPDETVDAAPPVVPLLPTQGQCGAARASTPALADAEVCIGAGSFTMGSTERSLSANYVAHGPEHSVTLSAYFLDAYEVTVARYRRCVDAGTCAPLSTALGQGCTFTAQAAERERHPVTCVSWTDARNFCEWDGARRLPTEAEWERAARDTTGSPYPWGEDFGCQRAVLAGNLQCPEHAGPTPKPVGSTPSGVSSEGAHDLVGNVAEWVADWSGSYTADAVTDPTGPTTGSARIQRGGGWLTPVADSVGWGRRGEAAAATGPFTFRCARDAER